MDYLHEKTELCGFSFCNNSAWQPIKTTTFSGSDYAIFRRLMSYAGPFKRQFYISTILAITLSLLTPLRPFLVGITVDTYILGNDYNGLVLITLISLLVLFAESICKYFFYFLPIG